MNQETKNHYLKHIDHLAPDLETDNKPPDTKRKIPAWLDFLIVLILAALVTVFISAFVIRTYQVDGPSMETTLQNYDKLLIWKVPVTWSHITNHQYVPKRGDVIVFTQSGLSEYGQKDSKQLIKRVIGLPGERVVVQNGQYRVFNKQHPEGFNPDKTLPYGGNNGSNIPSTSGNLDVNLDSKEIFVSGDNRPESLDSRTFGPVQTDKIVGKLIIRFMPVNKAKVF